MLEHLSIIHSSRANISRRPFLNSNGAPFLLQMNLLDRAVKMVAELDEPPEMNFVRKHALEQAAELNVSIREAATRVFSNASGSYSSNVNLAVENSSWNDEKQLQVRRPIKVSKWVLGSSLLSGGAFWRLLVLYVTLLMQKRADIWQVWGKREKLHRFQNRFGILY
jgi:hypothetical protein